MDLIGKKIAKIKQLPTIKTAQQIEQDVEVLIIEFDDGSKMEVHANNPFNDDDSDYYLQIKYK